MALTGEVSPGQVPLLVTAHLRTGVSMDLPYGLDLAGVLATRMRDLDKDYLHRMSPGRRPSLPDSTQEEPDDMSLCLARCTTGPEWHWVASCALPVDADENPDPRTFYRVVDSTWAQRAAERPLAYFHPSKGPYRDMMMPNIVTICSALQWHAVGDPERVYDLVRGIRYIGKRRGTGEGRVRSWSVEVVEPTAGGILSWGHVRGAEIVRPCPEECAQELGVDYKMGWYAIRPPSWNPSRLMACAMTPDQEEEW